MNALAMKRISSLLVIFGASLVSACVTINVYFPAAAAEKAADRIIEEVWGDDARKDQSGRLTQPSSLVQRRGSRWMTGLLEIIIPSAAAQQANLDISSPSINAIKGRMQGRHEQLKPHYDSGAVGLTSDGMVSVRDPKAVPLAERQRLNALVAEENRDRSALYAEIARANGRPEWENAIRETFARRWVDNAPAGWWFEASGSWKRK